MKTIHTKIRGVKAQRLMKDLYHDMLSNDSSFHFFYEPELVIRTTMPDEVCEFLDGQKIEYRIYDYPKPLNTEGNYCYECEPLVLKHLEEFKQIYHISSVFALTLRKSDYTNYVNRIEHTACNTSGMNYEEEGLRHMKGGVFRLQLAYTSYILRTLYDYDKRKR